MGNLVSNQSELATTCRNCGEVLGGRFCHECGQKHVEGRLDTRAVFSQFFEALTESDSTLWQTLRKLTRNPGRVALDYIEGGRAQYLNPVRFLLVTFTIYIGLMVVTGAQLDIASRVFIPGNVQPTDAAASSYAQSLISIIATQMDMIVLVVIPLLTLFIRFQYWRSGRNFAETFTFVCFVFGLGYLYGSLTIPIQFILGTFTTIFKNLITIGLFIQGARTFYDLGWGKAILGGAVSALLYLATMTMVIRVVAFASVLIDAL